MTGLTACLIVRDEAANLPDCLASVTGLVDEVVVYDTGSTDDTRAIAAAAGARVVQGYWDDDFARARNAALDSATGDWVLSIDADDRAVGDSGALLRALDGAGAEVDLVAVTIDNVEADGRLQYTTDTVRIFRRVSCRWSGRVHETPESTRGRSEPVLMPATALRLVHHGYADDALTAAKARRNAVLAAQSLSEAAADPAADAGVVAETALELGRSLFGAGQVDQAVDAFGIVRQLCPSGRPRDEATAYLTRLALGAGRADEALDLIGQLREAGVDPAFCDFLQAQAVAQLGRWGEADELLSGLAALVDPGGRRYDGRQVDEIRELVRQMVAR